MNIFDVKYTIMRSRFLDQWDFTMGGASHHKTAEVETKQGIVLLFYRITPDVIISIIYC